MAEKDLITARAHVAQAKTQLMSTVDQLKHRLKPATLASDAWRGIKDKSSDYAGKGVHAVSDHRGAAGGAAAAIILFLLRGPIATALTKLFGSDDGPGRVTTDLTDTDQDFDLTAPIVKQR